MIDPDKIPEEEKTPLVTELLPAGLDVSNFINVDDKETKGVLEKRFEEIFVAQTSSKVLNAALRRVAKNKEELLLYWTGRIPPLPDLIRAKAQSP